MCFSNISDDKLWINLAWPNYVCHFSQNNAFYVTTTAKVQYVNTQAMKMLRLCICSDYTLNLIPHCYEAFKVIMFIYDILLI